MDIKLKLKSNNKILEINNNSEYKLVEISGVESGALELNVGAISQGDGSYLINKRIQNRPISITVDYRGSNKEIERQNLISFFNPKSNGTLTLSYGSFEKEIEYEIEGFYLKLANVHEILSFTVDLMCVNPFWQDIDQSKVDIALWIGDFHFPLFIPKDKGITMGHRAPSLIVNVVNKGQVSTGMIIEFKAKGTLTNPSLFNVNTREFIKINKGMVAGEVIKINTNFGKKKILQELNGVTTNILNYIDVVGGGNTFLQLEPGDNLFRYDADSNLDNLEVSIYYSNNYLGV